MATPELSVQSPRDNTSLPSPKSNSKPSLTSPSSGPNTATDAAAAAAYESYLRLPELSKLWTSKDFPEWHDESILKPSLQALEITFRFVSVALSDLRPYANRREWARRLEFLAARQVELIATLCESEEDDAGGAPTSELNSSADLLTRERRSSSQEVWNLPGSSESLIIRTSEESLLPRLAAWGTSKDVAARIQFQIESQMQRCKFTLGLGEPNLAGKPTLEYDLVVRPAEVHALKKSTFDPNKLKNEEEQNLFTIHQILEAWLFVAAQLLSRVHGRIDGREWRKAASDCWMLERVWKLLAEVEDLHLLMDPDDLLRLVKGQLAINAAASSGSEAAAFCFRSAALREATARSKELRQTMPGILGVEADPKGGPMAAMRLFQSPRRGKDDLAGRVELLQAMQAVEAAAKRFYFAYRQVAAAAMGSLEAFGDRAPFMPLETLDSLSQMFLEPPYFRSLDAAKTFLADYWQRRQQECISTASPSN